MENKKIFAPNHQGKVCFKGFLCTFAILLILSALCFSAGAKATTVEVGIPVEEHPELFLPRSMPTHGEGKIAVFLIDFPDYRNDNPYATVDFYDKLYFSGGLCTDWSSWHDSVADFYYDQSYGKLKLSGKVFDWYTAKHERSYYDNRKEELVLEAAEYYIAQGVDFSQFDGNRDGVIDSLVYHFAGDYSMNNTDPWYSGRNTSGYLGEIGSLTLTTMIQVYDGAYDSDNYLGGGGSRILNTVCHELMHSLGMPDLYSERVTDGMPAYDLMCQNDPTINPYFKILLGWIDKVLIITEDTQNIRLDIYSGQSAGDVVIVTDKYKGLFDEFFIVVYRDYWYDSLGATAWHIDARLNDEGTFFKYDNLYYDPRPDVQDTHEAAEKGCPYMFIEELDSHPTQNYIGYNTFNLPTEFGRNSVIGPDSMPSTDTHDGEYTGIRIYNFEEHNNEYLTFNVSFIKDTSSPIVITTESDLNFVKTVKIHLNEHVYKGITFNSIKVTDPQGNLLDANIILTHYPRNEIEITFNDEDYLDGYKVVFPEGCIRDSSGNTIKATTLYASRENYIFSTETVQIPGAGEYARPNEYANVHFFSYDDSVVIIGGCWAENTENIFEMDAVIEFMRLDLNGNVLTQKFIRNPFGSCEIISIIEVENGSYLFLCRESIYTSFIDLIFCIDSNGDLKWSNDSYLGSGVSFDYGFNMGDGIVLRTINSKLLYVDIQKGALQDYTPDFVVDLYTWAGVLDLPDGKLLVQTYKTDTKVWEILDTKANQVTARAGYKCDNDNDYWIFDIKANDDGTYMIRYRVGDELLVGLLDAELNIIKSVLLGKDEKNPLPPVWIENDGFYHPYYSAKEFHNESNLHIRRYDRYLNLVWETELTANFIHFFKSPSGEILAYRSMLEPERECYIDNYGSEDARLTKHTHSLTYKNATNSTCVDFGYAEHWYCTDCGCKFSDEGITLITDINSIIIPIADHTEEIIPGYPATCINSGVSDGKKCSVCGEILLSQKDIPAGGAHLETIIPRIEPTSTTPGKTEGKKCSVCGIILVEQQTIPPTAEQHEHTPIIIPAGEPTCTSVGWTEGKECSVCGMVLIESQEIPAVPHTEVIIYGYAATCKKGGMTDGKRCSVCGKMLIAQKSTPKSNEHNPSIVSATEPTCTKQGRTEGAQCADCGIVLVSWSVVPKLEHTEKILPAIEPTYTTSGKTEGKQCSECGKVLVEQEIIPMLEPPAETTSDPETEAPSGSGCGASVSAILVPIAILGFAVIIKKKNQ